jgi:hypothetical protein
VKNNDLKTTSEKIDNVPLLERICDLDPRKMDDVDAERHCLVS